MNKESLTNLSNQLAEYPTDLGAAVSDAVKKVNIAPEKKEKILWRL